MCRTHRNDNGHQRFRHDAVSDGVGGRIGAYVNQYSEVRNSGERVVIDGACLSACTLVLGIVPRNRICVTRRAMLGFHAAWMPGANGKPVPSAVGTQALWDLYPQNVKPAGSTPAAGCRPR